MAYIVLGSEDVLTKLEEADSKKMYVSRAAVSVCSNLLSTVLLDSGCLRALPNKLASHFSASQF
jgi:hypothetical protein